MLIAILLALSVGCGSIPVEDGRIQQDQADKFKILMGSYIGHIGLTTDDGKTNTPIFENAHLQLDISKNNLVTINLDEDWLGKDCGMKVGKLLEFRFVDKNEPLNFEANFEVDPGKCKNMVDSDNPSLLLISIHEKENTAHLEIYITKGHTPRYYRRGGRPINYHGVFLKR